MYFTRTLEPSQRAQSELVEICSNPTIELKELKKAPSREEAILNLIHRAPGRIEFVTKRPVGATSRTLQFSLSLPQVTMSPTWNLRLAFLLRALRPITRPGHRGCGGSGEPDIAEGS